MRTCLAATMLVLATFAAGACGSTPTTGTTNEPPSSVTTVSAPPTTSAGPASTPAPYRPGY